MVSNLDVRNVVFILTISSILGSGGTVHAQTPEAFRDARLRMVAENIEREGITNPRVLESLRQVPRHEFVLPANRNDAYVDVALPINHKQTISPPYVVAYMTQTIDPQPEDRVLEIGTGSGYQAAVLSNIVKEVYSIEIIPELGRSASQRLNRLKYTNVRTKIGDGYLGWAESAPYDKIIVTCSPENVPKPLIDQLKEGGRLLIPLGERYQQVFHLFEKKGGHLEETKLVSTLFVPMTGKSEAKRRVHPDPLHPKIMNGDFEIDENEDGDADHWYYQRLARLVDNGAPEGHRCILFSASDHDRPAQALQATAIDGAKIGSLVMAVRHKADRIVSGKEPYEVASIFLHFFDENRRPIEDDMLGPWTGTHGWTLSTKKFNVPANAREVIIHIGLNGAHGKLWLDDLKITTKVR